MTTDWAREVLRPGDLVVVAQGVGEPTPVLQQILDTGTPEIDVFVGLSHSDALLGQARERPLVSFGAMGPLGKLAAAGQVGVIPSDFSRLPRLLAQRTPKRVVVALQVSPADAAGLHSFGVSVDYTCELLDRADVVIAEVNAAMPRTSAPLVSSSSIDVLLPTNRPLPTVNGRGFLPHHRDIARHIAALVPNGATLQLGIGSVPATLGAALAEHRDLRVRSTLVGSWLLDLDRSGALSREHGSVVISEAAGDSALYAYASHPDVAFLTPREVLRPVEAGEVPCYFGINSAVQVDLTGQVNAEETSAGYIGATGGQAESFSAAQHSPGGASVLALAATAEQGRTSRIVSRLQPATVTTPRTHIDFVVTEHGVADLRGRTLAERAEAMVSIAAPAHRARLEREKEQYT